MQPHVHVLSKRYRRGLVVGKFSPLHRGHMYLIEAAAFACDEIVVIGYSVPEFAGCTAERRERWLRALYPKALIVVPTDAKLRLLLRDSADFPQVPRNEDAADRHRRFCAALLGEHLGTTVDVVFSSEDYGDAFAAVLTCEQRRRDRAAPVVAHVCVDQARRFVPISGTELRADVHGNRRFLHPEVYASFVERVCFLGAESTGKSTLAETLARESGTTFVAEYGRERWLERGGRLEFSDYLTIAQTQLAREETACRDPRTQRLVFCDTSPLTTWLYQTMDCGEADPAVARAAERKYAHTFLCAPDFPLVQDGTRRDAAFRVAQHRRYRKELASRGIPFTELVGPLSERIARVKAVLGLA